MKYLIAAQRILFATVLTVLTACSDSGSTSDIDSRNLDREYSVSVFEGDEGTKTVPINFESAENSTISYETFNISAAEKSDYEGVNGSKQVQSGVTYPIEITLYSDIEIEGNEEFGVRFTDESGEVVDEQYIQILNDDLPAISVNSPEVSETDVGTTKLKFQFTLEQEVVDDYQVNISSLAEDEIDQLDSNLYPYVAREGDDFEPVEQVLTFTKNEKVKTIDVEVISEDIVEESEVVLLKVTNNEGLNVLSEVYAKGTIRTDETPLINGFDVVLDNEGSPTIEVIEGPADIQLSDSWKAVDVSFSIDKPENIKQSQRLSLRLVTQAEYEAIVDTTASSYVDFEEENIDICLSLPEESPSETDSCIDQQWKELTADQETISFDLYINQDLIREDSEPFLLVVENDQGVVFTTVPGVISNDDQEELLLKLPGSEDLIPLKDMKDQFVELPEPSGTSATYDLELQVTDIAGDYQIGYEILPYLPISPASLSEFDRDKATLTFNENNKSNTISVTLNNDDIYDGDKYIQVNFEEEGLEDIRIRIKDADRPKIAIQSVGNIDGSYESGFEVHEQDAVSYGVSAPETQYIDYEFELVILGTTVAFNDLEYDVSYDYSIDPSEAEKTACDPNTLALAGDQTLFASSDSSDFTLLIDGVESPSTLTIDRNTASKRFSVRVHNDVDIECIEQLLISFVPANIDDSEVVESDKRADLDLSISNRDGVEFQLTGFDISEELATTDVQISSSHLMNAQFELSQVTLPGQSIHACTDTSGDISFTNDAFVTQDSLTYTNTISIGPDSVVEPDETCNFEVTVSTSNNVFPYRFANESGRVSGRIQNDDFLTFTVEAIDTDTDAISSIFPEVGVDLEGNQSRNFIEVQWDKLIAENARDLIGLDFTFDASACDDTAPNVSACAASGDFESSTSSTISATFANTDFAVQESDDGFYRGIVQGLAIEDDRIFELKETAFFNISLDDDRQNSAQYIKRNEQDELLFTREISLDIIDNDAAEIIVNKISDTCTQSDSTQENYNQERECSVVYGFVSDRTASEDVDLSLDINITTNQSVNLDQYEDAVIYYGPNRVSNPDKLELDSDNTATIEIMSNGSISSNRLFVEFNTDEVVELDEAFALSFSQGSGLSYTLNLDDASEESYTFNNDDLLNIEVVGAREIVEPEDLMAPFSIAWDKAVDIPSEEHIVTLSYAAVPANCVGTDQHDCLSSEDIEFETENNSPVLTHELTIIGAASSHVLDQYSVKSADGLIELPEMLPLLISTESPFVSSIIHTNGTTNVSDDLSGQNVGQDGGRIELPWTLTVNSEEQLELTVLQQSSSILENCAQVNGQCPEQNLMTIQAQGAIASNGPDLALSVNDTCTSNAPMSGCLSIIADPALFSEGGDIAIAAPSRNIILEKSGNIQEQSHSYTVSAVVNDDEIVEIPETMTLSLTVDSAYLQFINTDSSATWQQPRSFTINSDDVSDVAVEMASNNTCLSNGAALEGTNATSDCSISYVLETNKEIAPDVPDLSVTLKRGASFNERLIVRSLGQQNDLYDVAIAYRNQSVEESEGADDQTPVDNEIVLPIHNTGAVTAAGQASQFVFAINSDSIVEEDERIEYEFGSVIGGGFFNYPQNFKYDFSISNDDFIELIVLGQTTQSEPDSGPINPFSLQWSGEIDLPTSELPVLTVSHDLCVGEASLECLSIDNDVNIDTSENTIELDENTKSVSYIVLNEKDDLVELPEKIDLSLSSPSPYVQSIAVINQESAQNDDAQDNLTFFKDEASGIVSANWPLTVLSDDKLILTPSYTSFSVSEGCEENQSTCTKSLGELQVAGNIAENGPSIELDIALSCDSLDECASLWVNDSTPFDVQEGTDFGATSLHTYNQTVNLPASIPLDVNIHDDELVEPIESFNVVYEITEGSDYIDSSSLATQAFNIPVQDVAQLILEQSEDTSCSNGVIEDGQTIYPEPEDTCDSVYRLKLSKAIADNVSSINASIVRDTTLLHPLSVKSSATEVGFDLAILSDANEQLSDAFTAPLHSNGSITSADTELAKITLRHKDDDELEVRESIKLDISSSNSNLVLVGGDHSSIHESIDSNDRVQFSLIESTETVNESSGSLSFTITSNSDIEQLDTDIVLTLQAINLDSEVEAELGSDYEISIADGSAFTKNGNQLTLATSLRNYAAISEDIEITLINDDIVEVDETIAFDLVIEDEDSSLVAAVNSSSSEYRAIIESDDRAVVTFYPSDNYAEGNIGGNLTHPVAYSLSNSIDSNVPTIYLDIEDVCDQVFNPDVNCVEFVANVNSSDDSGDVVKPARLQIHTAGVETEKTNIDQFPQGVAISNLYSSVDNTIEHHETLNLKFKVPVDSDTGGRMYGDYLSHIQNANDQLPLNLGNEPESEIVILNDDKIDLTISEVVDLSNDSCWNGRDADKKVLHEGLEGSSTCIFNISIDDSSPSVVADDVDDIQLAMAIGGEVRLNESLNSSDQVIDPADILLRQLIGGVENRSDGRLDLLGGESNLIDSQLELKIIDDDFVEEDEDLNIGIPLVIDGKEHEFVRQIDYDGSMVEYFYWGWRDYRNRYELYSNFEIVSDDTATVSIEMISHEDDQENITEGAIIEGNESIVSKLNYKISVDKGFAPEYPAVTASLTKTDSSSETTEDYSIDITSFNLHDGVSGTPVNTDHNVVVDLVTSDSVFELDETISYDLSVNQNQDTDSNNDQISYKIKDDDNLVITFTDPVQGVDEGTNVDTTTPVTLSYNVNNTISSDVPDITITPQNDDSTNQIEGDDLASGFSDIALHIQNNSGTDTEFTQDQTHTLQYVADSIVEIDEQHAFGYNVDTNDLLGDRISLVYQNSPSGISITLNNDDFVYLSLDCAPDCSEIQEGDTDADNGSINLTVEAVYTIDGIDLGLNDNKVRVEFSESSPDLVGSGDVGLTDAGLVTINQSSSAGDLIPVLNVVGDRDIEKDESSSLTFTLPEFVKFSTGQALTQSFTIKNDDYFSVATVSGSPMNRMLEGESFTLNICIPNEHSLPSDVPAIALSSTFSSDDIAESTVSQPLECADVTLPDSQSAACQSPGLISDHVSTLVLNGSNFSGGDCNQMPIFTSLDNEDGYSKWANVSLSSSSDERFQNFDQDIDLLVVNNDLTNMVDTGLTDCLASDLSSTESCLDHTGQDAAETQDDSQAYPDLKFTYVSNVGDPILQANNSTCLQDNATGFIWSKPISDGQEYAVVRDQLQSISDLKASYGCGFQDDSTLSWQHPSIEDLMTLLDLSLLGQSHPAQIRYLEETNWTANHSGSPITHARYWSSTSCGGANYLTLDFSTGIVACTHKNTESAQLIIYK